MNRNDRFKVIDVANVEMDVITTIKEIVDQKTGVHYLYIITPNGATITPLLNNEGNIVIDKK